MHVGCGSLVLLRAGRRMSYQWTLQSKHLNGRQQQLLERSLHRSDVGVRRLSEVLLQLVHQWVWNSNILSLEEFLD